MQESLEASHNLPGDAQHLRVSILVRALVRGWGWRHMGRAHTPVEGVGVAVVSGLDSCDSPSALSVPRARTPLAESLSRALCARRDCTPYTILLCSSADPSC